MYGASDVGHVCTCGDPGHLSASPKFRPSSVDQTNKCFYVTAHPGSTRCGTHQKDDSSTKCPRSLALSSLKLVPGSASLIFEENDRKKSSGRHFDHNVDSLTKFKKLTESETSILSGFQIISFESTALNNELLNREIARSARRGTLHSKHLILMDSVMVMVLLIHIIRLYNIHWIRWISLCSRGDFSADVSPQIATSHLGQQRNRRC